MDATTGQVIDRTATTARNQGSDAFLDLAGEAVDQISAGLCRAYWVGSITIMDDDNGTSKTFDTIVSDAGAKKYPSTVTLNSHVFESALLTPPRGLSQSTGDIAQQTALITYQRSDVTHSSRTMGLLDSCNAHLRNLTFTLEETSSHKAQDSWRGPVSVNVDQEAGTYTIGITGRDVNSQLTATTKHTGFNKAPCGKPPADSSVTDMVTLSVTNWELDGRLDPKNPYKLAGHTHRVDTGLGMTNTLEESWSLTLKNPPKSGTS